MSWASFAFAHVSHMAQVQQFQRARYRQHTHHFVQLQWFTLNPSWRHLAASGDSLMKPSKLHFLNPTPRPNRPGLLAWKYICRFFLQLVATASIFWSEQADHLADICQWRLDIFGIDGDGDLPIGIDGYLPHLLAWEYRERQERDVFRAAARLLRRWAIRLLVRGLPLW